MLMEKAVKSEYKNIESNNMNPPPALLPSPSHPLSKCIQLIVEYIILNYDASLFILYA